MPMSLPWTGAGPSSAIPEEQAFTAMLDGWAA